jgi:hypothetical protein
LCRVAQHRQQGGWRVRGRAVEGRDGAGRGEHRRRGGLAHARQNSAPHGQRVGIAGTKRQRLIDLAQGEIVLAAGQQSLGAVDQRHHLLVLGLGNAGRRTGAAAAGRLAIAGAGRRADLGADRRVGALMALLVGQRGTGEG